MELSVLYKVIIFWGIFYITPGPVWISVMEATRRLSLPEIVNFYFKVFFPVNITVQLSQSIVSIVFVDLVSKYFSRVDVLFYILGGLYISYLAYKTLKSKQANTVFELGFLNLALIMFLSPKIWLLFPSGAVIANGLSDSMLMNAFTFGLGMLIISSVMFVVYTLIGKVGTRIFKENFSYLAFGMLLLFALFLFNEAIHVGIEKWPESSSSENERVLNDI